MIEIQQVSKFYDVKPVLRKVSFSVATGEFVALLGPNGAGKTTLLRIIATLLRQTAGEVWIGGYSLPKQAADVRHMLGLVSHNPLLYPELTAEENLRLYGELYDVPDAPARIDAGLERVGLTKRRGDLVRDFSRGMQQRLAIARATLHAPQVMLCDEPHTGLDQQASDMLDEVLRSLAAEGATVVMTTHDLIRAARLADRVLILNRGQLVFDEPTAPMDPEQFPRRFAEVVHG